MKKKIATAHYFFNNIIMVTSYFSEVTFSILRIIIIYNNNIIWFRRRLCIDIFNQCRPESFGKFINGWIPFGLRIYHSPLRYCQDTQSNVCSCFQIFVSPYMLLKILRWFGCSMNRGRTFERNRSSPDSNRDSDFFFVIFLAFALSPRIDTVDTSVGIPSARPIDDDLGDVPRNVW